MKRDNVEFLEIGFRHRNSRTKIGGLAETLLAGKQAEYPERKSINNIRYQRNIDGRFFRAKFKKKALSIHPLYPDKGFIVEEI